MKKIKLIFKSVTFVAATAMMLFVTACQDDPKFGSLLKSSDLKYSVTQQSGYDNKVFLENQTPQSIAFWDYGIGTSIREKDTVVFPFAGEHEIKFTAFGRAGSVEATSKVITVTENDPNFFSDPMWNLLTNGAAGKTWVLDMSAPIGWAGLDYGKPTGSDNWNWFPSYSDASWSMENKDWGEMTFDLDGNYNAQVSQTALSTSTKTTTKGTYGLDIAKGRIKFSGTEMLFGGDYHPDVSNWIDVRVLELTETSLRLAVVRDQDRGGQGVCLIMFHFIPKPS